MLRATSFTLEADDSLALLGHVTLVFSDRFRRRIRLVMDDGSPFMLDLPEVTQLSQGGWLVVPEEGRIAVRAAEEDVLDMHATEPQLLVRWAWHLGNRHLPVEFLGTTGLRIAADKVIADMMRGLGADPVPKKAAFAPEGGAYGGGPTYGHSHHDH